MNDWMPDVTCRDSSTREVDKRTLRTAVAHERFKSEKARHWQSPETHCSADVLMDRPSFRKGTLNVFLRRDAEPEIQVLRLSSGSE